MTCAAGSARVAAAIVAFGPDPLQINRLIGKLARECSATYVMDNGGAAAAVRAEPAAGSSLRIIDMGGNAGLGAALNAAFEQLSAAGFEYVVTFDQDSDPGPGQVASLVERLAQARAAGLKVAAVGPRIVDPRGSVPFDHPFMGRVAGWPTALRPTPGRDYVETDFVITSGAVISMDAYRQVGPFDTSLFVDYTDVDWCMRARRLDYRLLGICSVSMAHELSAGNSPSVFGVTFLRYGPVRRYYYARNVVLLARRSHTPIGWKARLLLGLLLRIVFLPVAAKFSRGFWRDWMMLLEGAAHGLRKRSGPYPADRVGEA